jgi:hypothetical protein
VNVLFFSRPWTVGLHLALAGHWQAQDAAFEAGFVTQHLQAARALEAAGREVVLLPREVKRLEIDDPRSALDRIQKQRGPAGVPLVRQLMADRFYTEAPREFQIDQLARYAAVLWRLFEQTHPDLLVAELIDTMPGWLAHDFALHFGCEPVGLAPSTLPSGRLLMLRRHDEIPRLRENYERIRARGPSPAEAERARELQAIVTGSGTQLDYVPASRDWRDFSRRFVNGSILRTHVAHSGWQVRERLVGNSFVQPDQFLERLLQPFRALRRRTADSKRLTDEFGDRPFVFFPLHYEPEANLLVHGSYAESQYEVLRNVARSLPVGWDLVVKEHPAMRGRRRLRYYSKLRKIPNLRLARSTIPSRDLIERCALVVVVSGTVALEASIIGRPVLMFGEFPWAVAPTIQRVADTLTLPEIVVTAAGQQLGPDHPDVLAFAAAWDASLPPGRYYRHRGYDWLEPENVSLIATALENVVADARTSTASVPA